MDDLFDINAVIVQACCDGNAKCCPKAMVNLVADSSNSAVPIPPEDYKTAGIVRNSDPNVSSISEADYPNLSTNGEMRKFAGWVRVRFISEVWEEFSRPSLFTFSTSRRHVHGKVCDAVMNLSVNMYLFLHVHEARAMDPEGLGKTPASSLRYRAQHLDLELVG
ncbi:hypothetical protein MUK42_20280 [Musa troglodytarum]|uniref:Uncharacterized protein n=1 Tax=Musa troglodytarum TaxID=320322 RepID=A0A9E7FR35_9LILI|nr:hypothetical protein MUK42_20280 [Musa troglodytarum]